MARFMGSTQGGFGISVVGGGPYADSDNPAINSLWLGSGGLGLPDRDYYLKDSFKPQRDAYRAFIARTLSAVAIPDAEAAADYASIWDGVYIASLTDADIAGLKRENEIFVEAGAAEDVAPDELYVPGPFNEATAQ